MKRIAALFIALLLVGMGLPSFADVQTVHVPQDQRGSTVHPLYGGYSYVRVSSISETMVCTGKCLLGAVYMQTGATGTTLTIRDTGTADGGGSTALKFKFVTDTAQSYEQKIHQPLRFSNGISVQLDAINQGEEVTVGYIDLDRP